MKRYLKQAVQVVVLTVVLVFSTLLVLNSGVPTRDVQADGHGITYDHDFHVIFPCGDEVYHMFEVYH